MNFDELKVGTVLVHDHFPKAAWVVSITESRVLCYKVDDTDPQHKERFGEFTIGKMDGT